jgi:hypothetical protein
VESAAITLEGRVENGAIILEPPAKLPEGARVRVEIIATSSEPTLFERIGHLAGKAKHLPPDAAEQHDHYLYGTPKKQMERQMGKANGKGKWANGDSVCRPINGHLLHRNSLK